MTLSMRLDFPKNPKIRIALKIDLNTVDTHTAQNVFIYEKTKTVMIFRRAHFVTVVHKRGHIGCQGYDGATGDRRHHQLLPRDT